MAHVNEKEPACFSPERNLEEEETECGGIPSMLEDPSVAGPVLLNCFEYLNTPDLLSASKVSRLWNQLVSSYSYYWKDITLTDCRLVSPEGLARKMAGNGSRSLDLRGMRKESIKHSPNPCQFWTNLFSELRAVDTLTSLSVKFFRGHAMDISLINQLKNLTELKLSFEAGVYQFVDSDELSNMDKVVSLSLESHFDRELLFRNERLSQLGHGSGPGCRPLSFVVEALLPMMPNLRRLHLDDAASLWNTDYFMDEVAAHHSLRELELFHCRVGTRFDQGLARCRGLRKLTVAPAYRGIYMCSHQRVLNGAFPICGGLSHFTFGYYRQFRGGLSCLAAVEDGLYVPFMKANIEDDLFCIRTLETVREILMENFPDTITTVLEL